MEQLLYERPREKLLQRGVGALSITELLQVVIGSGGPAVSSSRLAREVAQCLRVSGWTPTELQQIRGMGKAKSCQVTAAIELGRRLSREH